MDIPDSRLTETEYGRVCAEEKRLNEEISKVKNEISKLEKPENKSWITTATIRAGLTFCIFAVFFLVRRFMPWVRLEAT